MHGTDDLDIGCGAFDNEKQEGRLITSTSQSFGGKGEYASTIR
jgi:hypothetical protein